MNDQLRGADEVMRRVYELLIQAAGALTLDHPAAESVGSAVDYLAGWLSERTVMIKPGSRPIHDDE